MQIIPVLDIQNGIVVHGVAGKRDHYRPIRSVLTASRDPSVLIRQIHETFGFDTFYIADLDAIEGRSPNRCTLAELTHLPVSLMVDGGIRCHEDLTAMVDLGVDQIIVALETLSDIETAERIAGSASCDNLWLSLDLRNGQPISCRSEWESMRPFELARLFHSLGFRRFIVLDLAAVGTGNGMQSLNLCREIEKQLYDVTVVSGGGVSDAADVQMAREAGLDGLLIASAIHSGQLTAADFIV